MFIYWFRSNRWNVQLCCVTSQCSIEKTQHTSKFSTHVKPECHSKTFRAFLSGIRLYLAVNLLSKKISKRLHYNMLTISLFYFSCRFLNCTKTFSESEFMSLSGHLLTHVRESTEKSRKNPKFYENLIFHSVPKDQQVKLSQKNFEEFLEILIKPFF